MAAAADFSGRAIAGINLNQTRDGVAGTWTPTGERLVVNLSNPGNSALRFQISGTATSWFTNLTQFGTNITIPWGSFNTGSTECPSIQ